MNGFKGRVTQEEFRTRLREIAHNLAQDLGTAQAVIEDGFWCPTGEIRTGIEGFGLYIHADEQKRRLTVRGLWPKNRRTNDTERPRDYGGEHAPEISMSIDKPGVRCADDIRRRLLPDYRALWNTMDQRRQQAEAYWDAQKETEDLLERELTGRERIWRWNGHTSAGQVPHHTYETRHDGGKLGAEKIATITREGKDLVKLEVVLSPGEGVALFKRLAATAGVGVLNQGALAD